MVTKSSPVSYGFTSGTYADTTEGKPVTNWADSSLGLVNGAHTVGADPITVDDTGITIADWPTSDFVVAVWDGSTPRVLKAVIHVGSRSTASLSSVTWNYGTITDVDIADGDIIGPAVIANNMTRLESSPLAPPGRLPVISSRWYGNYRTLAGSTTASLAANTLYFAPFYIPVTAMFDAIGINVTTAGAGGTLARLGIYDPDADTLQPSALLLDAGTVAVDATGSPSIVISQSLTGGRLYWLAVVSDGAPAIRVPATAGLPNLGGNFSMSSPLSSIQQPHTFGALPDPAVPVVINNNSAILAYGVMLQAQ